MDLKKEFKWRRVVGAVMVIVPLLMVTYIAWSVTYIHFGCHFENDWTAMSRLEVPDPINPMAYLIMFVWAVQFVIPMLGLGVMVTKRRWRTIPKYALYLWIALCIIQIIGISNLEYIQFGVTEIFDNLRLGDVADQVPVLDRLEPNYCLLGCIVINMVMGCIWMSKKLEYYKKPLSFRNFFVVAATFLFMMVELFTIWMAFLSIQNIHGQI